MDRDLIQRRDFPTGRRGYDAAAVDEHLRRVADAFESNVQAPAPSLATSTSEHVREILEAAERSVSQVRADAHRDASEHVAKVQQGTEAMLGKLDELESELGRLLAALRTSAERLTQGLAELQADVGGGIEPELPPAPEPEALGVPLVADDAGARLIALNMALGGSSREESAAYLAEHFELADSEALLDDVYARAGR